MKFAPVSTDLLIKIGLGGLVLGGVALVLYQLKNKISHGTSTVVDAVNPASPNNVIYSTMNQAFGGGDPAWTLGGWVYEKTHPDYDPNPKPKPVEVPYEYPIPIFPI